MTARRYEQAASILWRRAWKADAMADRAGNLHGGPFDTNGNNDQGWPYRLHAARLWERRDNLLRHAYRPDLIPCSCIHP